MLVSLSIGVQKTFSNVNCMTHGSEGKKGIMRNGADIISTILKGLAGTIKPGVNGKQVEEVAEKMIQGFEVQSINKGYNPSGKNPFPSVLCISVNSMIAHGIPLPEPFIEGDLVNLDMGIMVEGMAFDAALTVGVGKLENKHERLLRYAKQTLYAAIEKVRPGVTIREIAHTIETYAAQRGYVVNKSFCGHGIGKEMHMPPQVYNTVENDPRLEYYDYQLKEGEVICIEPMLTFSDNTGIQMQDGWLVATRDGKYSAMFEHMVKVTKDGHDMKLLKCKKCGITNEKKHVSFYLIESGIWCTDCYQIEFTGKCKDCYGKGYRSEFHGISAGDDFGNESRFSQPIRKHIYFCDCPRGKDLKELIELNYVIKN